MRKSMRLPVRLWADRRGSNYVEFVFVLPILAWMVVGIFDVGRAIHYHQALTEGVRAGARYLTRLADPCSNDAMEDAVGLLVTRSIDWSEPPLFPDWPPDYGSATSSSTFEANRLGCDPNTGTLGGSTVTMEAAFEFADTLSIFNLTLRAGHQERYIGL